ncbi:hypothetical protein EV183_001366 [Coemansia sp. RSA 2336]|nr:hypothetical protein EV183_001366 [Coemansia sp. RSA 2336]
MAIGQETSEVPQRSSFIGIHTRTPDMKVLFISSGTRGAIGFAPTQIIDKTVEDFVVEGYSANDYMGMYDLREADEEDEASAYTWFAHLRHSGGNPVLHRFTAFKLDNCVIFLACAFPEIPYSAHTELTVQVLDGKMKQLNATRKREAREAMLTRNGNHLPLRDARGKQVKAAVVLEHPDALVETEETGRRTAGPLVVFVTGSISQIVEADPSDLARFPFMKLVAPEDYTHVCEFFDRLESTVEVLFERFSLLRRPHVCEGDVVVSDGENERVLVECLASAAQDGVVLLLRKMRVVPAPKRDTLGRYVNYKINDYDDGSGCLSLAELISSDAETTDAPDWSLLP